MLDNFDLFRWPSIRGQNCGSSHFLSTYRTYHRRMYICKDLSLVTKCVACQASPLLSVARFGSPPHQSTSMDHGERPVYPVRVARKTTSYPSDLALTCTANKLLRSRLEKEGQCRPYGTRSYQDRHDLKTRIIVPVMAWCLKGRVTCKFQWLNSN